MLEAVGRAPDPIPTGEIEWALGAVLADALLTVWPPPVAGLDQ
jgi:hypothetical protein